MIRYGTTSFGNNIWINWRLNENDGFIFEFPKFDIPLENLEALTVFHLVTLRLLRRNEALPLGIRRASQHFQRQVDAQAIELNLIRELLGIQSAIQLANHSRHLLANEFKE